MMNLNEEGAWPSFLSFRNPIIIDTIIMANTVVCLNLAGIILYSLIEISFFTFVYIFHRHTKSSSSSSVAFIFESSTYDLLVLAILRAFLLVVSSLVVLRRNFLPFRCLKSSVLFGFAQVFIWKVDYCLSLSETLDIDSKFVNYMIIRFIIQ